MAHITSFTISGLAGRPKPLSLSLNPDINIFFGKNGAGKTSLLRIFESAMSQNTASLEYVPFAAAEVTVYSKNFDRTFTHRVRKPKRTSTSHGKARRHRSRYVHLAESYEIMETEDLPLDLGYDWETIDGSTGDTRGWRHGWLPVSRLYHLDRRSVRLMASESPRVWRRLV